MLHESLQFFSKYIEKELGIVYTESNYFQLRTRLEEIAKLLGFADIEALYQKARLGISGDFKQLVLDTATNNETSFFRDPKVFQVFENVILPELTKNHSTLPELRIWSAASSFGQEAYSLSMLLHDYQLKHPRPSFKIVASDIAERVLERARKGRFSQLEIQRGLPMPLALKHFEKDDQNWWTIKSYLKKNVEFRKQNLLDPFASMGTFHVIFCRNVLIYQNVENKTQIIKRLTACLAPGGYLVLGAGESLIGLSDDFEFTKVEGIIWYKRKSQKEAIAA